MSVNEKNIPIVLFVFRRLDTVKLIIEKLREIQPVEIYVFSDGARVGRDEEARKVSEVRSYIEKAVDWQCIKHFEFAEKNKGCANNIQSGINQVFSEREMAIILEDDAVPRQEFFEYCYENLLRYKDDKRIQYLAGFNAVGETDTISNSYTFSKQAPMSGAIATWADRWNECDFSMKSWPERRCNHSLRKYYHTHEMYHESCLAFQDSYLDINDGWDYQFHYDLLDKERFAIVPRENLVTSYGYVEGAFHVQDKTVAKNLQKIMTCTEREDILPLVHPDTVEWNSEYDKRREILFLQARGGYFRRHIYYVKRKMKDLLYKYMPRKIWNMLKKIVKGR